MEIIVRKSCPYTSEQLVDAANVGFTEKFKVKSRGLGNRKAEGIRQADSILQKLDKQPRDLSWLKDFKDE